MREIEAQLRRQEPELARLLSSGLDRAGAHKISYSLLWCGLWLVFSGLVTTWDNVVVAGLLAISAWPAQVHLAARSRRRSTDAFSRVDSR